MVTTTEAKLTPEQQTLYNNLKAAIQSGVAANVDKVLNTQDQMALSAKRDFDTILKQQAPLVYVFNAENLKLYDLLDYTTDDGRKIAGVIFKKFYEVFASDHFTYHLSDKICNSVMDDKDDKSGVTTGILEFAKTNGIACERFFGNLLYELKCSILNGKKENANKIFDFAKKKNYQKIFLLKLDSTLRYVIRNGTKSNVVDILNFASTNNVLKDVLNYRGTGATVLELAKQEDRVQIIAIIEAAEKGKLEPEAQHEPSTAADKPDSLEVKPTSISTAPPEDEQGQPSRTDANFDWQKLPNDLSDYSNETPTFFSKHGEKIAFGVSALLIGAAVATFLLGLPYAIGIITAVLGAVTLLAACDMAYNKVSERADKDHTGKLEAAGTMLNDMLPERPKLKRGPATV